MQARFDVPSFRSGSTAAGSLLAVNDQGGAQHDNEMRSKRLTLYNARPAENCVVASSFRSGSTTAGSLLAVNDQGGAEHDNKMRRKYAVFKGL